MIKMWARFIVLTIYALALVFLYNGVQLLLGLNANLTAVWSITIGVGLIIGLIIFHKLGWILK